MCAEGRPVPNARGLAANGRVGVHGNKEGKCVCVSVSLSPPPDTAGKAANGGKGENELEGKK